MNDLDGPTVGQRAGPDGAGEGSANDNAVNALPRGGDDRAAEVAADGDIRYAAAGIDCAREAADGDGVDIGMGNQVAAQSAGDREGPDIADDSDGAGLAGRGDGDSRAANVDGAAECSADGHRAKIGANVKRSAEAPDDVQRAEAGADIDGAGEVIGHGHLVDAGGDVDRALKGVADGYELRRVDADGGGGREPRRQVDAVDISGDDTAGKVAGRLLISAEAFGSNVQRGNAGAGGNLVKRQGAGNGGSGRNGRQVDIDSAIHEGHVVSVAQVVERHIGRAHDADSAGHCSAVFADIKSAAGFAEAGQVARRIDLTGDAGGELAGGNERADFVAGADGSAQIAYGCRYAANIARRCGNCPADAGRRNGPYVNGRNKRARKTAAERDRAKRSGRRTPRSGKSAG